MLALFIMIELFFNINALAADPPRKKLDRPDPDGTMYSRYVDGYCAPALPPLEALPGINDNVCTHGDGYVFVVGVPKVSSDSPAGLCSHKLSATSGEVYTWPAGIAPMCGPDYLYYRTAVGSICKSLKGESDYAWPDDYHPACPPGWIGPQ